ncbi:unnamed protein product [Pylaiella littoralis]
MEDVSDTTLSGLLARITNVIDLPLPVFQASTMPVCDGQLTGHSSGRALMSSDVSATLDCANPCTGDSYRVAVLSDSFEVSWEDLNATEVNAEKLEITLTSSGIPAGESGWMGIGWGGLTMATAQDFVICQVFSDGEGQCTDRGATTKREVPPLDADGTSVDANVTVSVDSDRTSVTFIRDRGALDDNDYDLGADIDGGTSTLVIYAYGTPLGEEDEIEQHASANRGAATVSFSTGNVEVECEGNDFLIVHGSLMLVAWMVLAPLGIYYVRYRKGESIRLCSFDFEWFEMHQELMIIASEAVLPLAITAVFASGGDHTTSHAHWGYYLIAAVALQVFSGFVRVKGLEAAQANFSWYHRFNKHFHIWSGRIAYLAGAVQCYRGLELVSGDDNLILSAGDGLDLELSNYDTIKNVAFPLWFVVIAACFVFFESRKQYRRFFKKGSAKLCGIVEVVNPMYEADADGEDEDIVEDRLVPRTEALPLYTMAEFNEKVLHGQSWVLVDGAVLDVSEFSHRHPGGARLVLNAVGTDVTHELLGEDLSVGHAMSFAPHRHPQEEEEEEEEEERVKEKKRRAGEAAAGGAEGTRDKNKNQAFRIAGKAVLVGIRAGRAGSNSYDLQSKAQRTNDLAELPDPVQATAVGNVAPTSVPAQKGLSAVDPGPASRQVKRAWSSKKALERYHVCPLLFREKMGTETPLGRGQLPTKRPVYRYVFSCPGQAQVLVEAINGVCHFNVRGQPPGKGIIQRSYNAYAVRVQESDGGGVVGGGRKGTPRVVPASETTNGELCVEMRIRIYHDGAMSQLLEQLAKAKDNPAVQLQGPYVINKLVPPPAHRNVIMIAAGTGVNPMVQQIRDYLALPRVSTISSRSRLSLVWQSTSEAELYGTEEITALQAKSKGLLEVTVLISGDQRRRNVPGAAFKRKLMNKARAMVSPMMSSIHSHSSLATMPEKKPSTGPSDARAARKVDPDPESDDHHGIRRRTREADDHQRRTIRQEEEQSRLEAWERVQASRFGPHPKHTPTMPMGRTRESKAPSRRPRPAGDHVVSSLRRDPSDNVSEVGGGMTRGKVTREILERIFGPMLLKAVEGHKQREQQLAASTRGPEEAKAHEKEDAVVDTLAGTDSVAGRLQVVVSGPSGFVFYVENILTEMGVPSSAVVLLD